MSLLIALLTALFVGAGATTASAAPRTATPAPVAINQVTSAQSIVGTFNVSRFANQNGQLTAIGTFTGTVTQTTPTGTVSQTGSQQVALPVNVQQSTGSCQILDLVLGPLHLDLLGLVVDLNQVHLTITAVQGPGNLLGNLLCAVANLLNGPTGVNAILTQIANLLNQLLGSL